MLEEEKHKLRLEIAHILFVDIVGYSKLLVDEQHEQLLRLNAVVRRTAQFQSAETKGELIRLPTGDGMALVFLANPEAPVRCAMELDKALKAFPEVQLRMGIHSGPVNQVSDVNERSNVAGAGINMAQRVMDCGDAGHILLSKRLADDLLHYRQWQPLLHELGEFDVKHGLKVSIVNLYSDEIGNRATPGKLKAVAAPSKSKPRLKVVLSAAAGLLLLCAAATWFFLNHASRRNAASQSSNIVSEKSIAVLPLENLSEDKANAFFADGIQDDVLTSLSQISDLKVISRTSVMQYRGAGAALNLKEIAKALGVANVLEGSVRRVGNRVLVNVQLIDALHDKHIWAERYDRTLTDSIGLQGELATKIAHALRARLDPQETARLKTQPTNDSEAYVLYLKARDKEHTAASRTDALVIDDLYGQAVALDPKFALAVARQSMFNSLMYSIGRVAERKVKAHALAAEALRLAPDLAEAHLAQGLWFYRTESDFDGALKEFAIAEKTMANDPELLSVSGEIDRRQRRWRQALAKFQRVQELDPRNSEGQDADTWFALRDWSAAAAGYRRTLAIGPDVWATLGLASVAISGEGNLGAAKAVLEKMPYPERDSGGHPIGSDTEMRWNLSMLERDFAAAEKVLVEFEGEEFPPPSVAGKTFDLGCTAFAGGDLRRAGIFFEKARPLIEGAAREHPDSARFHAALGLLYAYLDRKQDALRESHRAVELCPESRDAIDGPRYTTNFALVCALTGDAEQAVTLLERLITTPAATGVTLATLRLSWKWDSLRKNSRFQKIIRGPEPPTVY